MHLSSPTRRDVMVRSTMGSIKGNLSSSLKNVLQINFPRNRRQVSTGRLEEGEMASKFSGQIPAGIYLKRWILEEKWGLVEQYLQCCEEELDNVEAAPHLNEPLLMSNQHLEDSAIHLMCRHHPPVEIVEHTIKLFPHLSYQLNYHWQTPLHLAAACGASPGVVRLLLENHPTMAFWKDYHGKTPLDLHLQHTKNRRICDAGDINGNGNGEDSIKPTLSKGPMLPVMRELIWYSPVPLDLSE